MVRLACCRDDSHDKRPCSVEGIDINRYADIDVMDISFEAARQPLPCPPPRLPSDRTAHRRRLQESFAMAQHIVAVKSEVSLHQGRCCVGGLVAVLVLRASIMLYGPHLWGMLLGIHGLASVADGVCTLCALPFYAQGTGSSCVQSGYLGPFLTLLFSMCLADASSLASYVAFARPQPLEARDRSLETVLQAMVGPWDLLLFASMALQLALCVCSWRIYQELRLAGLYPPGQLPMGEVFGSYVSLFELVCEAGEAHEWSEGCEKGHPLRCADGFANPVEPMVCRGPGSDASAPGDPLPRPGPRAECCSEP